ncbi:MAG TPA: GDP-mannose 4,6-dehydratase [bacterium]|mgnify:FL=1|nr:GDP-mannose 4,6-dehydratase [bacterium]HPP87159.1 GDP-mannose 4,6-dehydratase [bacterium]
MKKLLITGGAGFIGANCAKYFYNQSYDITIIDNLSRNGAALNINWLKNEKIKFNFYKLDITNKNKIDELIKNGQFDVILHLAAQVAVTTSIINPRCDFETNALGTLNLLEALRKHSAHTILLYSSTNKVYGKLENLKISERNNKYELHKNILGVSEDQPLSFYSPYGCSKGAADQYCLDYARIYNLKTIVFRQSCIYGIRQFGIEDQGWVAWLLIAHLLGKQINIYGNGKQVRDLLYIDDLIQLYYLAINNISKVAGQVFNIGGGKKNALSVLQTLQIIEKLTKKKVYYNFSDWRSGDQKLFISSNIKAKKLLSWQPKTDYIRGLNLMYNWINKNIDTIRKVVG